MSEIKRVTIEGLYKLDSWKMKDVSHDVYKKINKVFKNRLLIDDYFENGSCNLDLHYDKTYDGITWSKRDNDYFFNNDDNSEVKLIEENETKKVNLEYLLDNDKWQLKVTPEQSEMVQLALFDVGVTWVVCNKNIMYTNKEWLSREVNSIYHGNGFNYESLELEPQTPQNDFETQQGIWEWLISGKKITDTKIGGIVEMVDGFVYENGVQRSYCFLHPSDWKKVTNWYDKLDGTVDNGVVCWVGGNEGNLKLKEKIELIKEYRKNHQQHDGAKYKGSVIWWELATPLTNDEIKVFMVGE